MASDQASLTRPPGRLYCSISNRIRYARGHAVTLQQAMIYFYALHNQLRGDPKFKVILLRGLSTRPPRRLYGNVSNRIEAQKGLRLLLHLLQLLRGDLSGVSIQPGSRVDSGATQSSIYSYRGLSYSGLFTRLPKGLVALSASLQQGPAATFTRSTIGLRTIGYLPGDPIRR